MRHAAWWKPFAVVSALVLGGALVWHQARVIAQGTTANPPPAAPPEVINAPAPEAEPAAPSAAEVGPRIIAPHPGGAYFSTSKSSAAMMPVFPAPAQRQNGGEARSRRSMDHSTSKGGALHPAISLLWGNPFVYVPPVDKDRNAAQEEEASDE